MTNFWNGNIRNHLTLLEDVYDKKYDGQYHHPFSFYTNRKIYYFFCNKKNVALLLKQLSFCQSIVLFLEVAQYVSKIVHCSDNINNCFSNDATHKSFNLVFD